ncbi:DUF3040 domain-containing protein [Dermabacteraceae bacterium P13128]
MPLSEYEQRVLAEMEKHLFEQDPELASALREDATPRKDKKRVVLGVMIAICGFGLLIAGMATQQIWLGMLAFLVMLAGALTAILAPTVMGAAGGANFTQQHGRQQGGGFMDTMQKRWESRE